MENLHVFVKKLGPSSFSSRQIVACIDLTALNESDTHESITALCKKASNKLGSVAAVCCYPTFLETARAHLHPSILLATVVNFPSGTAPLLSVLKEVDSAFQAGADEIDLVIPYASLLKNKSMQESLAMTEAVKKSCGNRTLKVIIESGTLADPTLIYELSLALLKQGADFIKTSTGKTNIGATPEAASAILDALRTYDKQTGIQKGLKISGGVRTAETAHHYMTLASAVFGSSYLQPSTFRLGASSLLDELLHLSC